MAKVAGDESIHDCMTPGNNNSWQWTMTKQPTNDGSSKGGWRLVTRAPDGSGQRLGDKEAGKSAIDWRGVTTKVGSG